MRILTRLAIVAIFVCAAFGMQSSALLAQGNVVGTTYTSPHFDYQVQWNSPWYFVDEGTNEGVDYLVLADGVSYVEFRFNFLPGMDALFAVDVLTSPDPASGNLTNVQPLLDSQGVPVSGGDASHALGGITGTYTLDDGTTVEMADYYDVRILPGGVLAIMDAYAPLYFYDDSVLQGWQNLASTALILPETPATTTMKPTAVPEVTATPPAVETVVPETPAPPVEVGSGVGEPAPAFAAGPWRIAARAVDQGEEIGYLGLTFIDGMRWVVVYADVTNWSAADATLEVAGMALVTAGGLVAPDQAATQSAATSLGLEPANGASVPVPAGGSTRVALVYSIPVAETELIMELQGQQLPLADAVGQQFDVTDLSTIATPPAAQSRVTLGLPVSISGPPQFIGMGEGGITDFVTIILAGVELPQDACFDSAIAQQTLMSLQGTEVVLETDPAVTEADTYYVWYLDDQGNWVLLNQELVAKGLAVEGDLPNAARFGAWIEQTEEVARANGTGLWATCAGQL